MDLLSREPFLAAMAYQVDQVLEAPSMCALSSSLALQLAQASELTAPLGTLVMLDCTLEFLSSLLKWRSSQHTVWDTVTALIRGIGYLHQLAKVEKHLPCIMSIVTSIVEMLVEEFDTGVSESLAQSGFAAFVNVMDRHVNSL